MAIKKRDKKEIIAIIDICMVMLYLDDSVDDSEVSLVQMAIREVMKIKMDFLLIGVMSQEDSEYLEDVFTTIKAKLESL